jgi:phosphate-selective porin OprO and OprP
MRPETKRRRRWALALVGCAFWAAGGSPAPAQGLNPVPAVKAEPADDLRDIKQQIELQKQQIDEQTKLLEELKKRIAHAREAAGTTPTTSAPAGDLPPAPPPDPGAVEKIVGDYLQQRDEAKRQQEAADRAKAEADGHKVGTDLRMSAHWNPLNGVTLETPNKDFVSHFGFWFQYDSVWFNQNANLKSSSQVGDLQDGSFFRRIRPQWEGQAWEVMEWDVILQLEQVVADVPQIDECWVGLMNLPVIGSVRVGKTRIPQGLEAGSYTGFKAGTFMEQSAFGSAFYEDLGPGVWTSNSVLNNRATWEAMFYRQDNVPAGTDSGQNGVSFGDGKYAVAGRLSALPIYENEGRQLLHLAVSGGWRKAEDVPVGAGQQGNISGPSFIDFRARPLLRDSIGDYGGTNGNNATPVGLSGDSKQMVETGFVGGNSSTVFGTELLYILGPFSFQAEYGWASVDDAFIVNVKGASTNTRTAVPLANGTRLGTPWFSGGYAQVSYFLTGENRRYDTRYGRLSRSTIGSPFTPFWLTKGEDGHWLFGRGAWELAARWNHLSLDNGVIQGGQTDAYEVGVNWYLNPNLKIQCEYLWQDRSHLAPGQIPGDIQGLGIRTQFFF